MDTYKVIKFIRDGQNETIAEGLTREKQKKFVMGKILVVKIGF
jgi:hypothetical protein